MCRRQGLAPHGQGLAPHGQGLAPHGQGLAPHGHSSWPQGLAPHGHRDDKISWTDDDDIHSKEGNLVELVRFWAETDVVFAEHLVMFSLNIHLQTIQNELVEVTGHSIWNDIIVKAKQAKLYSVIADEDSDTANKKELSLSVHFVFVAESRKFHCF